MRFLARRARAGVDARDLAQEAYVRLLRLDRKDLIREPLAYVYRVASNLLHEFELKRRADLEVCVANPNLSHRQRDDPSLAPPTPIVSMAGCVIWPFSPSISLRRLAGCCSLTVLGLFSQSRCC